MGRFKKAFLLAGGVIAAIVVLLILFLSPIAKYLIKKYDVALTGREIDLDWIYLNPFTGYVHINNLVIYEHESEVEFFTTKSLSANMAMLKILNKTYEISSVTLQSPRGVILQHVKKFNFNDIIERFTPKQVNQKPRNPVRFSILNIKIIDGEFHYEEDQTPVSYYIKNVDIQSDGWRFDVDTMPIAFSFSSGVGTGDVEGVFTINLKQLDYHLDVKVDSFNLEIINQYLKDLTNYGTFAAFLDADIITTGRFDSVDSLRLFGDIAVSRFHFGRSKDDDFASFESLIIAINDLSPKNLVYDFDSISLQSPYFKFELYDYLDNVQTMFGSGGSNVAAVNADPYKFNLVIEIAKLVEQLSRNFLRSDYKVGRVAIYNGDIQFVDYSLSEKFNIELYPFTVIADSVDRSNSRVDVHIKSGIKPYGSVFVSLTLNPGDTTFFDLDYHIQKVPLTMFNPYLTAFTSYPLDRGSAEVIGKWNVRNGEINSDNHLIIVDPRLSDRVKNKENGWIPLTIAMGLVREKGNVIDYEIPIRGSMKDPKFKLRDVVFDVLTNIFVKPVSTPYRMEVKSLEKELEKSLTMKFNMQEVELTNAQDKFIGKMADFLKKNPEAEIVVTPNIYSEKENEYILIFEAKKQYYLAYNKIDETLFAQGDSLSVAKMSMKDDSFNSYLNEQVNDSLLFTVQHKASRLIDNSLINEKYNLLLKRRMNAFLAEFKEQKVENQIIFNENKSITPFNGYSYYSITYNGDFPEYLVEAVEKMNELDSKQPREEYKDKRNTKSLSKASK
jgi:hypothetical protein